VPLTLPGERWLVRVTEVGRDHARALPVERRAGPPRASPPCPHFGHCGGCTLQHLPAATYHAFKLARIERALQRARLTPDRMGPLQQSPLGSRRRLRLAATRSRSGFVLGFRAGRSRAVAPIGTCPIARPELVALFQPLRTLLPRLTCLPARGELMLTATPAGVDLLLEVADAPGLEDLEHLAGLAQQQDLARVVARSQGVLIPIAARRQPQVRVGPFAVPLPPGAFLQATEEGERALQGCVAEWLADATRIADLYAGLGTLSLPLVPRTGSVTLVERDGSALAAAAEARPRTRAGTVTLQQRDLDRQPLLASELQRYDAVILDPPRAGALAQIQELARAPDLARIAYVSCHPGSFARDAAALSRAGWRLQEVRPVDQFLFSAEIELAALFGRD
jgi:23S rRNA (uracil1939-C5)-methyltransferase